MVFHNALLKWYVANRRDLPWRRTADPYAIWVSEIMLQQTRVATVVPFYERWMRRFPTIEALAGADEQEVLSLWQGLGYYRRCRLLLAGARFLAATRFAPKTASEWLQVPGVGPYTAGAIASIAFNDPAPLVDGNVERVFARLANCDAEGSALKQAAWKWASAHMCKEHPGDWNQALMELGATLCRPVDPDCRRCPIKESCVAFWNNTQYQLPDGAKGPKTVELVHLCWIPYCEGKFGVRQIPKGQWWEGMWEFPRVSSLDCAEALEEMFPGAWPESLGTVRHTVTHHRIHLVASLIRPPNQAPSLVWRTLAELESLPLPTPQRRVFTLALKAL